MSAPILAPTLSILQATPAAGSTVSFNNGHNKVTIIFTSDVSLDYAELRVTKAGDEAGLGIGNLAHFTSGNIAADQQQTWSFNVTSDLFDKGDGTYILSLYARNALNGYWSDLQLFMTIEGYDFIPAGSDSMRVQDNMSAIPGQNSTDTN